MCWYGLCEINVYTEEKLIWCARNGVSLVCFMPEGVFSRARSLILIGIRAAASYKTL